MNVALKLRQAAVSELMKEHREWYDERLRFYKRQGLDAPTRKNNARRDLVEVYNDELRQKMGYLPKRDELYSQALGKIKPTDDDLDLADVASETAEQILRYTYYREFKQAYRRHRYVPNSYKFQHSNLHSRAYAIMDVKAAHVDEFVQLTKELTADFIARRDSLIGVKNDGCIHY